MKKAVSFLTLIFIACSQILQAQTPPEKTELGKYIEANYSKREVEIPMRDGVKLFTAIYEPKNKAEKYPILLNRTPYTISPYGADKFRQTLGPSDLYAKEGFIFVYQDVRGKWKSEGEFVDVRPHNAAKKGKDIDENSDTYDTIDWLVKNVENNSGKVGIYGISYPGFYAALGAIDSHPALKAASPQAPIADWFIGDDFHHNGALFLPHGFNFYDTFGQPRPKPIAPSRDAVKPFNRYTNDGYKYFLEMGSLANSDDKYREQVGDIPFWNEMMKHPNYDEWWQARRTLDKLKNVRCAVMTVGGWFDAEDLYGALETYRAIERQNPNIYNVLVMGPWVHGGWSRTAGDKLGKARFGAKTAEHYREKLELPFFNKFLKDKGDISGIKEVNVFETGSNEWESYDGWNPKNVSPQNLYLQSNGRLSFNAPKTAERGINFDSYVSDPQKPIPYISSFIPSGELIIKEYMTEDQRFASTRTDVLTYQTEPLTEDLIIAGDIKPTLFVSTSGSDADFIVKLIDVFPDDLKDEPAYKDLPETESYQMLIRGEPFRARFRNSFEKPEALTPNRIEKVAFTMPGSAHTFKKGHRIMIQIQSSWFPLVDRNPQKFVPNIFEASEGDFQPANHRVYRSTQNATRIELPIIKK